MAEVGQDANRIDLVEAGIDAQLGLLGVDEQQVLGERLAGRFGWQAAGSLVVAQTAEFSLDRNDFDLTVAALSDLGVKSTKKQPIPEFEEVVAGVKPVVTYLGEHVGRGDQPELTFRVPLAGRYNFVKLIDYFDMGQEYDTAIWHALWDRLTSADHNHGVTDLSAAVMLNDTTDPADRTRPANGYNEAGLVYVNQTVPQQRTSLETEQGEAAKSGVQLDPAGITEYVVVQAKRRLAGRPLLDKPTVTRFPQYPDKKIGGDVVVPDAYVDDYDRLYLDGSYVGYGWDRAGVRREVRVA